MFKLNRILLLSICISLTFIQYPASAGESFSPIKSNSKKWRIGYYEGNDYYEFAKILRLLIISLQSVINKNFIKNEELEIPEVDVSDKKSSRKLWSWISKNIKSDHFEFIDDAFWSSDKEDGSCDKNEKFIYQKTSIDKDIDLVIAMGTVAGKCLSEKKWYNTNTIVIAASNPVLSGIFKKNTNNDNNHKYYGIEHIHAVIEKDKFYDEIQLFYKIVGFKKLGIVYKNNENEKIYSAVEDARRVANESDFELIEEKITEECIEEQRKSIIIDKYKELAKKVDAIYIAEHSSETEENIIFLKELINFSFEHKIATWSQTPRTWMVKYGVLMSLSNAEPADIAMFSAKVMEQMILNGKKPGEISQLFVNPKNESITLNLETAQKIQLDLSWEALATAEKIYVKTCKDIKDDSCEKEE